MNERLMEWIKKIDGMNERLMEWIIDWWNEWKIYGMNER